MKKFTKILALTLVLVMMVCVFASCGKKLSGSYEGKINIGVAEWTVTYTFSGSKVNVERKATTILGTVDTVEYAGTYEIAEADDGKMEITFTFETEDDTIKSGTYTFEEGESFIKIGIAQYNKVEK